MTAPAPYVELHAHSAFSFLDGASSPLELAGAAAALDYPAFALTDHDGVWGSMEFAHSAVGLGLHPITGTELTVRLPGDDGTSGDHAHLTLLVEDEAGYRNLCRLLTAAHSHTRDNTARRAERPWTTLEEVERHSGGLICLSGCARFGVLAGAFGRGDTALGDRLGRRLLATFGRDRFRVELQRPFSRRDRARNRWLSLLADRLDVASVATGNVHAHARSRYRLQDAMVAIGLGETLESSEPRRRGNSTSALASPEAMAARFAEHPAAVAETVRLAERLTFDLTAELGYRYPGSEDGTADDELARICAAKLADRYAASPHRREAEGRLEQELGVIRGLKLSGFFLLHRDMLELAREVAVEVRGPDSARSILPPGRGRGSSVSSIVCFLTGLSHVDPVEAELFSGRFLNDEATSMPDIDLDFPRDIREVLIPRVHDRYGHEHSAMVAAFVTYQPKSAVRDLGKALGLPPMEVDKVAKTVGDFATAGEIEQSMTAVLGADRAGEGRWHVLLDLASEIIDLPRNPTQHSGGMVISTRPLIDLCPIVPAAMVGRQIVQWDKDSCADAGFLKMDFLALGMLSAVERTVAEVGRTRDEQLDLSRIPLDDEQTYESIRAAETVGVFQIESRAQMQMLPRTQPRNLEDLTVQVALVRPGPIQGGAIHPYIERRKRLREDPGFEIPYPHPLLRPVLEETLGTIVYQEQVIEVAMALAGFSSGKAEGLRRAMSKKRSRQAIEAHHADFVRGAVDRGVPEPTAERVWQQVQGFSGFGFPKAHSAAFGLLAYQSAWLRVHRGPEFLCSLLNEQPMGFYPPASLVNEARRRGIRIAPVDANRSRALCHVESPIEDPELRGGLVVRIGLGYVKGVRGEEMDALVSERDRGGIYRGIAELASRSGVGLPSLERLAWAGALDGIPADGGDDRRGVLWRVGVAGSGRNHGRATQLALPIEPPPDLPDLEPLGEWGKLIADYRSTGLTLGRHPLEMLRPGLDPKLIRSNDLAKVRDGAAVEVAGMVVARQRPQTANGIVFMLIEDERGSVNLIVPPPVYDRHRSLIRTAPVLRAKGKLERRDGTTNVVVNWLAALERTGTAAPGSRSQRSTADDTRPARDRPTNARVRRQLAVAELRAVAPAGHSFGRGRR
ncbi:MAG TPA: error-prone DNA polymerase [Solirubrobacterales bacterium]|nr:error-prone DNA polymerase [Solirubrobacterales bacterium]